MAIKTPMNDSLGTAQYRFQNEPTEKPHFLFGGRERT